MESLSDPTAYGAVPFMEVNSLLGEASELHLLPPCLLPLILQKESAESEGGPGQLW